jgi:Flp pilus assembly protein TadD
MKLSLSMIVKNEAEHLGHCLDSVRGLVDEMVIVDTGSSDGTAALARDRGATVHSFDWVGDFSAARNESLAHATGDWVLVLDADEAVDVADHARIREACLRPEAAAFRLPIRSYLPDGAFTLMDTQARANPGGYREGADFAHCGETSAVRLFRREPWARFRCRIHEMVDPCFLERGLPIPDLDAVIHHYGFTLAARVEAKKAAYLDLARRDALDHPEDGSRLFHLIIQASAAEDWEGAWAATQRYRTLAGRAPLPPTVLLVEGLALQRLGRQEEALRVFDELLVLQPHSLPATVGRGVSLERLGRAGEARRIFEACILAHPDHTTAYLDLADLLVRGGEGDAARAALVQGLARSPGDRGLWSRLVRLGIEAGAADQAVRDAWGAIQACPGRAEVNWFQLVGIHLLRQGAVNEARTVLLRGLEAFPAQPDLTRLMEHC